MQAANAPAPTPNKTPDVGTLEQNLADMIDVVNALVATKVNLDD